MAYLASSINSGSSVVLVAMMGGDTAMRSASGSCDRGCGGRCLERADDAQSMSAVGLEHGRAQGDDGYEDEQEQGKAKRWTRGRMCAVRLPVGRVRALTRNLKALEVTEVCMT